MRPNRTTAVTALTLAAVVGLAGCGAAKDSGKSDSKQVDLSPVAAVRNAQSATVKAGSATFTMSVTVDSAGSSMALNGSGAFDYTRKVGKISMELPAALTQGKKATIDEIVTATGVYMSGDLFGQPGKWVKVDLSKLGVSGMATQVDPSQLTKTLETVTTVTKVGSETVDGVKATHYKGTLDAAKAFAMLSGKAKDLASTAGVTLPKALPFDSWVDDQGRLVKVVEDIPMTVGGQTQKVHVQIGLGDFGKPVAVTVPTGAQVVTIPGLG
jgi:hypothetical protein